MLYVITWSLILCFSGDMEIRSAQLPFRSVTDRSLMKVHAEIGLTRLIRSQGYEVDVMLTSVHSADVADYCNPERAGDADDHLKSGGYFGSNVHPYEIMFAKANRGIDDNLLTLFTAWHYQMKNQTSWDKCSRKHAS